MGFRWSESHRIGIAKLIQMLYIVKYLRNKKINLIYPQSRPSFNFATKGGQIIESHRIDNAKVIQFSRHIK